MSTTVFDLRAVSYRYPEVTALENVTLAIEKGERIAVLGANGSGKSTLLRLLAALAFPSCGTLSFYGKPLTEGTFNDEAFTFEFRRRVALIFQNPDAQLFSPSVFDEVAFGPLQLRWPKAQILERVDAALASLQIEHLKHRAPHRLSGGEKKRVALASVLILDPEVLLLDEPTAGLDPQSQSRMIDFLIGCGGVKTAITCTHELHIIEDVADRCLVLKEGRIVADGTPARILADENLLQETHLLHSHRHRHSPGIIHSHPHSHRGHDHTHPS
ncbi:MAG: energy-coupling factor ABC transporter ATP-binding protein [Verrucomicrobia bacterium]|nr:energy-coupling factor ABC transporter ATP-binding protein [Verrucomicrobiota bacterium]